MRLVFRGHWPARFLLYAQRALLTCSILFLSYFGFVVLAAFVFQTRESREFDRQLREMEMASGAGQVRPAATPAAVVAVAAGGLIGRMEIPRLRLSAVVMEGTSRATLRRAVGHISGSALPGEPGNVCLSGHRDTYFRPLKDLRVSDKIRLSTLHGAFDYIVESLTVVEPERIGVLAPTQAGVLTLVTCYPFYYVGAAPQRFVVRARLAAPATVAQAYVE
jgi:sortase A